VQRRPRALVIGLDACAPDVVRQFVAGGHLPTIARLLDEGATATLQQEEGYFVGSTWPTMMTGVPVTEHLWYTGTRFRPETYDYVLQEIEPAPLWHYLDHAGRRVAVLDVPHFELRGRPNVVGIREFGCHDRFYGPGSHPPELLAEVVARHGEHPIGMAADLPDRRYAPCDARRSGPRWRDDEIARLHADLLTGVRRKTQLSLDLLQREPWDLFVTVYGESHCAGHHLWHLHDPEHVHHDGALARRLSASGDPLLDVYAALDEAVGALAASAGGGPVYLVMSHGMRRHHDGMHLLPELLDRLDVAWRRERGEGAPLADGLPPVAERSWFLLENNTASAAVRINLTGREGSGRVSRSSYDEALTWLADAFGRIRNDDHGGPVARRVVRSDEIYRHSHEHLVADLLVEWEWRWPIERISSPEIGTLALADPSARTGEHHRGGVIVAAGPGIARQATSMSPLDVMPTLAAAAGVEVHGVPGRVNDALLPRSEGGADRAVTVSAADLRVAELEGRVDGLLAAHHETRVTAERALALAAELRDRVAQLERELSRGSTPVAS